MIIGRITKVDGIKVVGTFYEKYPPHLIDSGKVVSAPQINSFVKTNVGLDTVICQIVGEHEFEYERAPGMNPESQRDDFMVDLEVRGRLSNGVFMGGLRCLPIVGAQIELMGDDDYNTLFGSKSGICVGTNLFDSNYKVYLDPNKLMASHIGIFGNTGSGKSNTLSKIIGEYYRLIPEGCKNAHILIYDLNNEYGSDAIVDRSVKTVYNLSTHRRLKSISNDSKIPLNVWELTEDNWGTLLRATQKTQMPVIRRAYRQWKNGEKSLELQAEHITSQIKRTILNKKPQQFYTFRDFASEYYEGLDDIEYNKTTAGFYVIEDTKYIHNLDDLSFIKRKVDPDPMGLMMLHLIMEVARGSESGTNFDYIQPLIPRMKSLVRDFNKVFSYNEESDLDLFKGNKIAIVQLANVNSDTRELVPSLLSEMLFQRINNDKDDSRPNKIFTIIIDEAHNLLSFNPDNKETIHDNTLRVFERIIKEGRKFGMFLCLSSQRPSDISDTITSQIHNFFIHKLVNPRDIEKIRKTVSFMGDSSLSMLSVLGQGECIISGPSLYMPQYVYISELDNRSKPNSGDITLFGDGGILD